MRPLRLEDGIVALTSALALQAVPALRSTFIALSSEYQRLVPCKVQEGDKRVKGASGREGNYCRVRNGELR
jgi:hypothetical protein